MMSASRNQLIFEISTFRPQTDFIPLTTNPYHVPRRDKDYRPIMIDYMYTILIYCYILQPMDLIECVTSLNNHIINLNCIFYYVFQQNFSIFMNFRVRDGFGVWVGWVLRMMCMGSHGNGMGAYE